MDRNNTSTTFLATFHTLTRTSPSPPDHLLHPANMSDRIKEFIEVPQQFIRDGNQVRPRNFEVE